MAASVIPHADRLLGPPRRLGRYRLLRHIGRGGMAEVFLARASGSAELVAVKLVRPELRDEPGFEQMLIREAVIAANLDHPNIVRVLEFSERDHYIVMEYVDGISLGRFMRHSAADHKNRLSTALNIIHPLCQALHMAHESRGERGDLLGLVHRDVTPSNVLLGYDGTVKLADFGVAKATARAATTIGGTLKGKVGYMSPEQCRCESIDRRSDVFSLGVILQETTLGHRLFPGLSGFELMGKVLRGEFLAPRDLDPCYPAQLNAIVLRATAAEPSARFQTALDLCEALEDFARANGIEFSQSRVRLAIDRNVPHETRTPTVATPNEPAPDFEERRTSVRRVAVRSTSREPTERDTVELVPQLPPPPPPRRSVWPWWTIGAGLAVVFLSMEFEVSRRLVPALPAASSAAAPPSVAAEAVVRPHVGAPAPQAVEPAPAPPAVAPREPRPAWDTAPPDSAAPPTPSTTPSAPAQQPIPAPEAVASATAVTPPAAAKKARRRRHSKRATRAPSVQPTTNSRTTHKAKPRPASATANHLDRIRPFRGASK